jgi:hypothetical protein
MKPAGLKRFSGRRAGSEQTAKSTMARCAKPARHATAG